MSSMYSKMVSKKIEDDLKDLPPCRSCWTTMGFPLAAAAIMGVVPWEFGWLGSAPNSVSRLIISMFPSAANRDTRVSLLPGSRTVSGDAPDIIKSLQFCVEVADYQFVFANDNEVSI